MSKLYTNNFYNKYAKNTHSQWGEDGIIEEILNRLKIENGWVCEFGAWDGVQYSNTFRLIQRGFKGVYIEGAKGKYVELLKTAEKYPNIIPIHKLVKPVGETLDSILAKTEIPEDFDILSVDVDSCDYQIWKSLENYNPKIVIIEIVSQVDVNDAYHVHGHPKHDGKGCYGQTAFRPMYNLGLEKNYKFALHTGNMIFVRNDLFEQVNINYDNELENFRLDFAKLHKKAWCEGKLGCPSDLSRVGAL
jgi:hypothetical protein